MRLHSSFLSYVDLQGTTYTSPSLATGFGAHIAQPILRKALEGKPPSAISKEEAESVLVDCMKVLFYRDARSINKVRLTTVSRFDELVDVARTVPNRYCDSRGSGHLCTEMYVHQSLRRTASDDL